MTMRWILGLGVTVARTMGEMKRKTKTAAVAGMMRAE